MSKIKLSAVVAIALLGLGTAHAQDTVGPTAAPPTPPPVPAHDAVAQPAPSSVGASATTAPTASSPAPSPGLESPYGTRETGAPLPPLATYRVASRSLPPGYREHDGFFLRMLVGAGVGGTRYRDNLGVGGAAETTRTIGGAGTTELAIGASVTRNLIVHGTLSLSHMDEVKKVGDQAWGDEELSTLLGFFGAGVTYYFMPNNIYITGSVGLGGLSQTSGTDHTHHESDVGFGTSIGLGKEWWLGRTGQWAIGIALTASYFEAPLEIEGIESTYRGYTSGLAFSTTFH